MSKRDARRDAAQMHIADMAQRYRKEIMDAAATKKRYKGDSMSSSVSPVPSRFGSTATSVVLADSVSAMLGADGKVALLDFASYHNPGGGYDNGAWAQEEALCSESILFNVIDQFYDWYYAPHKKTHRGGLYTSDALYLSDIVFERDGNPTACDVIVMAAPNARNAREKGISEGEISQAMRERVFSVMNIAADNGVDTLVAGAFGCGVFANDPYEVAEMFKEWIDENPGVIGRVVFGIPGDGDNYQAFCDTFPE